VKLSVRTGLFTAAVVLGPFLIQAPSKAMCLTAQSVPPNTCTLFDPTSSSSVNSTGGFTGGGTPGDMAPGYEQAQVYFRINGTWDTPFTISGISLTGEGITSSLVFPDLVIPTPSSMPSSATGTLPQNLNVLIPTGTSINFANNTLSFTIPANVANISSNFSSISASLRYLSISGTESVTSTRVQFTATTPTPGPIPILGLLPAFGFTRRLRQRIQRIA
jgi:hypothetical protein